VHEIDDEIRHSGARADVVSGRPAGTFTGADNTPGGGALRVSAAFLNPEFFFELTARGDGGRPTSRRLGS
jgi:hypothetical protein